MLPIEIRTKSGTYQKGQVLRLLADSVIVCCEGSTDEFEVRFNDLRLPSNSCADLADYQPNEEVEAFVSIDKVSNVSSWCKLRVKYKKESFVAVEGVSMDGTRLVEVVPTDQIRKPNNNPPLTKESFFTFTHECQDQKLLDVAKDPLIHRDFTTKAGGCAVFPDDNRLVIVCLDETVERKAKLLFELHLRYLKTKCEILSDIEAANYKLEQTKLTGTQHLSEKFSIKHEFVGLAIGSRGSNIQAARDIEGVINIELHPSPADPNIYDVLINGHTQDAINRAREMVEYIEDYVLVPEALISRVIGRNGRMLQDIVDKTQVIKIRIQDKHEFNEENKSRNGESHEGMVPLWCIGSREAYNMAKMMIEYQIESLQDLESVKDQRDQLNHQLQTVGVAGVSRSYSGNGFRAPMNGAPWRGSRGGPGNFRGGRGPMRGGQNPYFRGGPPGRFQRGPRGMRSGLNNYPRQENEENLLNSDQGEQDVNKPNPGGRSGEGQGRGARNRGRGRYPNRSKSQGQEGEVNHNDQSMTAEGDRIDRPNGDHHAASQQRDKPANRGLFNRDRGGFNQQPRPQRNSSNAANANNQRNNRADEDSPNLNKRQNNANNRSAPNANGTHNSNDLPPNASSRGKKGGPGAEINGNASNHERMQANGLEA